MLHLEDCPRPLKMGKMPLSSFKINSHGPKGAAALLQGSKEGSSGEGEGGGGTLLESVAVFPFIFTFIDLAAFP